MTLDRGLIDWAEEAAAPLGAHSWRAMMGGATLYCDGVPYAIVAHDSLWFKADAGSDGAWDAVGAERFSYPRKDGSVARMNYRRAPEDAYDDADAFRHWAAMAVAAGRRAAKPRRRRAG